MKTRCISALVGGAPACSVTAQDVARVLPDGNIQDHFEGTWGFISNKSPTYDAHS